MMFAERDEAGKIVGLYARPQPGRAEEELADDHIDVVAFRDSPKPPAPLTGEEVFTIMKAKGLATDADRPRGSS